MMENYKESCNKTDRMEKLEVICQANIIEMENCSPTIAKEENYDFGAEITKQQNNVDDSNVDDDDDDEIKTKNAVENVTSTKTATVTAKATTIITDTAASDSGISLEKCQSDKCDYDTADGEDEADDENEDDSPDEDLPPYAHNTQQSRDGSVDSSDDDTSTSTDSDFSDISGLSDVSGKEWKPVNRKPILWVQKQIHSGRNPRELLSRFLPAGAQSITLGLNDMSLWRLLANMLSEPPRRQKLRYVNTFDDVIRLILNSKNIVVLTGAGVSVSCGIPDFRSSDGIYSRLAKDYPNLPDPQAMFDIDYFSRDPRPFYKFAREIYPGQFKPSPCHRFIKLLEEKQLLLRNYTQNIDTLEQVAGIKRVIECHGSFSTASCTKCKFKCDADAIRADIFAQRIPVCPRCQPHVHQSVDASEPVSEYDLRWIVANGIMKPDIVFFGEGLPDEFHKVMASDKDKCDLLIVIGSSLKVRPVALIPSSLPANVPQILINREQLNHLEFDVELLGDSDVIINQICHRLGDDWKQICFDEQVLKESKELQPFENDIDDDEDDDEMNEHDEFDDINENESESHQLNEIDTQSAKSNMSVGINLRAITTTNATASCSDSGFESSTSTSQTECTVTTSTSTSSSSRTLKTITGNVDELAEIENIKTSILDFNERPNVSDDNDFQPFSVRLGQDTLMTPPVTTTLANGGESLRHLSIDSTKDSGIQCDCSNSMATNATLSPEIEFNDIACSSSALKTATLTETDFTTTTAATTKSQQSHNTTDHTQSTATTTATKTTTSTSKRQQRKSKSCSAAEFLIDGTYYYHKNSSSYVFPGAQISWYADDSEDTTDLEEDNCDVNTKSKQEKSPSSSTNTDNKEEAENHEEEQEEVSTKCDKNDETMVMMECKSKNLDNSDISTPLRADYAATTCGLKRNATREPELENNTNSCANDLVSSSPPPAPKKCRIDTEFETITTTTPATAILTTTINTSTVCSADDTTSLQELVATSTTSTNTTTMMTTTILTLPSTKETLQHI